MAWKVRLESIQENPVLTDSATMTVVFFDGPNKEIRKDYKVVAGTTLADAKAMLIADRDALRRFEAVKTNLQGLAGTEIT